MSYLSVWDFGRDGKANYSVHGIGEYPSKIRPIVISKIIERFSKIGDTVLDPFCGGGTVAVECKLQGRNSINFDINQKAISLTKQRLDALTPAEIRSNTMEAIKELKKGLQTNLNSHNKFKQIQTKKEIESLEKRLITLKDTSSPYYKTTHISVVKDARQLDLEKESIDAIITDIPYASMIKYSDLPEDLSTIVNYNEFLREISKAFAEMWQVLKKDKYCVIFVGDYRIAASRKILPLHADVIDKMTSLGFSLFDLYIWRYYRSGAFRPFGKKPFQAMNVHSYILVFHKPGSIKADKPNADVKYRKRLIEKLKQN
jgi:DNA modification methylase